MDDLLSGSILFALAACAFRELLPFVLPARGGDRR